MSGMPDANDKMLKLGTLNPPLWVMLIDQA
jgi:hypothetical protein